MGRTAETNSLEVRWFEPGDPPTELGEWVTAFGPVETSTRTDLYLSAPDSSVNAKLRGGGGEQVELKCRLSGPERRVLGPGVVGDVEQWYKWSFSLDHTPGLWECDETGLWVPVEKSRTLCTLDKDGLRSFGADPEEVTAELEITEVEAPSERAWTCCLEVAGPAEELGDAFDAVALALFGERFGYTLSAERSMGYAGWLQGLASGAVADEVRVRSDR
jgi:hypothetical protein